MSASIVEWVNTSGTGNETHSLSGHEPDGFGSAVSNLSTLVRSEEVARQIKAATGSLTRQLKLLCDETV